MTKQEMRRFFLNKRREADLDKLKECSEQIERLILQYIAEHNIKSVMAYAAFRNEPETLGLIRRLLQEGVCVGLPACEGKGIMEVYRLQNIDDLAPGRFGILEPPKKFPLAPDAFELVLVPGTGYGRDMSRVGYGAGYYDRYLPQCKNAVLAGVTYGSCLTTTIPQEEKDVRMDLVFTEKGIVK